jgi:hypothetical protein
MTSSTHFANSFLQDFFPVAQQFASDLDCLIAEVSRSHSIKHTLALPKELFWISDQPYLPNSQQTQETKIHDFSGILTRDSWNRGAADISLRPHGHWDWPFLENSLMYFSLNMLIICCRWMWIRLFCLVNFVLRSVADIKARIRWRKANHLLAIG